MIFTFPHDPNGTNETLFQNTKLELSPGITVLVGCNGSGKSTLLHLIERHCLENEIPCFSFDNKMQGGTHAMSAAEWSGDVDSLTSLAFHSKGEQISACLGNTARAIGRKVRSLQNGGNRDAGQAGFLHQLAHKGVAYIAQSHAVSGVLIVVLFDKRLPLLQLLAGGKVGGLFAVFGFDIHLGNIQVGVQPRTERSISSCVSKETV